MKMMSGYNNMKRGVPEAKQTEFDPQNAWIAACARAEIWGVAGILSQSPVRGTS